MAAKKRAAQRLQKGIQLSGNKKACRSVAAKTSYLETAKAPVALRLHKGMLPSGCKKPCHSVAANKLDAQWQQKTCCPVAAKKFAAQRSLNNLPLSSNKGPYYSMAVERHAPLWQQKAVLLSGSEKACCLVTAKN